MRVDVYHHFVGDDAVLKRIEQRLASVEETMTQNFQDIQAQLGRINAATTDIAGDIKTLMDTVSTSMTQDEVDQVKAGLTSAADTLEGVASEFPATPV